MSFEATVAVARTIKEADSYPLAKLREIQGRLPRQIDSAEVREMTSWRRVAWHEGLLPGDRPSEVRRRIWPGELLIRLPVRTWFVPRSLLAWRS
ncbi:MAG: hypothetical protein JO034_22430 [Singulisphaera sp.]|nr:hypothetical protein [Singulisphaera sp.]